MKVLMCASECAPIVKVGGVADVIGSLPTALRLLGIDARVVIPYYEPVNQIKDKISLKEIKAIELDYDNQKHKVMLYETVLPETDVTVYLIFNEKYISNGGIYFTPDTMPSEHFELDRFAFFSKAICSFFAYENDIFSPDVVHCHDWHTGMVPQIGQNMHKYNSSNFPKTIFTIHNLAYQGFTKLDVADKLGLDIASDQTLHWDAQDDNLDFILQGIVNSDYVTTVSEKYAKEVQTPQYGEGLHDILMSRKDRLRGIINGISYTAYNPETDKDIKMQYGPLSIHNGKPINKEVLQQECGLTVNKDLPVLGIVSRLAHQKGLDLVLNSLTNIIDMGWHLIVLGTGDPQLEASYEEHNTNPKFAGKYKGYITFSGPLAMKIYAGADAFLIPSRFEPCGLTQMISMKYGTLPIVRATGGLADTVEHMHTGFVYEDFTEAAMISALEQAIVVYSSDKTKWHSMIQSAMSKDFSWKESAKKYVALYQEALR